MEWTEETKSRNFCCPFLTVEPLLTNANAHPPCRWVSLSLPLTLGRLSTCLPGRGLGTRGWSESVVGTPGTWRKKADPPEASPSPGHPHLLPQDGESLSRKGKFSTSAPAARAKHLSAQITPIPVSQAPYTISGLSCMFMEESAAIPRS